MQQQGFKEFFRCYPISMMHESKSATNYGGKIYLPQSSLQKLTMLNVRYPMIFKISNSSLGKSTHSGVLEFTAEEGRCYLPDWMMSTLGFEPGSLTEIESTDLEQGTFVKLEPQSTDFLDISDPKIVLENALRHFTTLTIGDIFELNYNDKIYKIKVLEVKPVTGSQGICVIETDLVTDFAPPVGYVEPDYAKLKEENDKKRREEALSAPSLKGMGSMANKINYGNLLKEPKIEESIGVKLNGKKVKLDKSNIEQEEIKIDLDGPPRPLELPDGYLFFGYPVVEYIDEVTKAEMANADTKDLGYTFQGDGKTLRNVKKRKDKNKVHTPQKNFTRSPEAIIIDDD